MIRSFAILCMCLFSVAHSPKAELITKEDVLAALKSYPRTERRQASGTMKIIRIPTRNDIFCKTHLESIIWPRNTSAKLILDGLNEKPYPQYSLEISWLPKQKRYEFTIRKTSQDITRDGEPLDVVAKLIGIPFPEVNPDHDEGYVTPPPSPVHHIA